MYLTWQNACQADFLFIYIVFISCIFYLLFEIDVTNSLSLIF